MTTPNSVAEMFKRSLVNVSPKVETKGGGLSVTPYQGVEVNLPRVAQNALRRSMLIR